MNLPENPPVEKAGKVYGITCGTFNYRWWNYYERGLSFLEGECWTQAESDFREALKLLPQDHYRIRTYGRHLTDYFPHRELGVALFHQERYHEALAELEFSLNTEKSARAEFYLDRTRLARLELEKRDFLPPVVTIRSPSDISPTNRMSITITGQAEDDTFVKAVHINGQPVRIDLSAPRITFSQEVNLDIGENTVRVEVQDLTGKYGRTKLDIFCDRTGPVLDIRGLTPDPVSGDAYILNGYGHDSSGIHEIRINGQKLPESSGPEMRIEKRIFPAAGQPVDITLEDRAGNRTSARIFPSAPPFSSVFVSRTESGHKNPAEPGYNNPDYRGLRTTSKQIAEYREKTRYHALLIGINAYKGWPALKNAVNDVTELRDILIRRYSFRPEDILLKTDQDATWDAIIRTLREKAEKLTENDNLLVYFAGHGQIDKTTGDGYWIPVDGLREESSRWITNSAIRSILCADSVRGRNILVIADACYSGTLLKQNVAEPVSAGRIMPHSFTNLPKIFPAEGFRGNRPSPYYDNTFSDNNRLERRFAELGNIRSRQVIASGSIEPVTDNGGDRHSLFAHYLLKALAENEWEVVDIEYLYNTRIFKPVTDRGGQRPAIGRLDIRSDEGGQFVLMQKDTGRPELPERPERNSLYAERDAGTEYTESTIDNTPPTIEINGWSENRIVYIDRALIEFNIRDESGIQQVKLNGDEILGRPGRNLHLNYLLHLREGENTVRITCRDQLGNTARKAFRIIRNTPKILETGMRMSVALFPFEIQGETDSGAEKIFAARLHQSRRFHLLSPDTAGRYGNTIGMDRERRFLELARQEDAEYALTGTITAGKNSLNITARIIDTEKGDILTVQDVYGEYLNMEGIRNLCEGLVVRLCDDLPLIEGQIVRTGNQRVLLNRGSVNRIRRGMRLIFFRANESLTDPETGENLGADVEVTGTGKIRQLMPRTSWADMMDGSDINMLEDEGRFIMK